MARMARPAGRRAIQHPALQPRSLARPVAPRRGQRSERYKWIALVNTTMGVLMVTIDGSIVLIAMPDIFRGIGLDPSCPATASTCCG